MSASFNPIQFTRSAETEPVFMFWGNGHTNETLPANRGWRVRRCSPQGKAWVVGQKGVPGCASIVEGRPGTLDVAFYDDEPKVINDWLLADCETRGCVNLITYRDFPEYSGVGLSIIHAIDEYRKQS